MSSSVIVGTQWGDEGKGKIIDVMAAKADVVVRSSGGNNAGHTVVHGDQVYKLHLLPSGILYPETLCLIGSGVVEPIGAVLTLLAAQLVIPALPYLLSFAAGAMLYVVVEELIPEMSQGRHSNLGTVFFAVGFSVMMMLDVALG